MSEANQKITFLTRRDRYLRLPKVRKFLVPVIVALILAGLCAFLFFGQMTVSYTGLSYEINNQSYLLVPYVYQKYICPENETVVWIGNEKGKVIDLITDEFMTAESIKGNRYFDVENNPLIQKDMTYLLGTASFEKEMPRVGMYKVVLGTVRPVDYFFGGAQ